MTIFPQPVALAAAFDPAMLHEIATIIAEEMRAVANLYRNADGTARSTFCLYHNAIFNFDYPQGNLSLLYLIWILKCIH